MKSLKSHSLPTYYVTEYEPRFCKSLQWDRGGMHDGHLQEDADGVVYIKVSEAIVRIGIVLNEVGPKKLKTRKIHQPDGVVDTLLRLDMKTVTEV